MTEITKSEVMELLKKQGFHFKKGFGQNFLFDRNLLKRIVRGAEITPGDSVVEIGPGAGTLTKALAETGARVLAVEIDTALIPILREILPEEKVTVIQGDILKVDLDQLTREKGLTHPYKIVANLPYYITTPIIMDILEKEYQFEIMVIMVQWEVAERLTSSPGTKDYGAITLAVQYYCEPSILFKVPRHLFTPVPEVDSAVLLLRKRKQPPVDVKEQALLFKVVKAAFGQRRKTLLNALGSIQPGLNKEELLQVLDEAGIDGMRRGETLSLEEFARLANAWGERKRNH